MTSFQKYPVFKVTGDMTDIEVVFTEISLDGVEEDSVFTGIPDPSVDVFEIPRDHCSSQSTGHCTYPELIPRIFNDEEVTSSEIFDQMQAYEDEALAY